MDNSNLTKFLLVASVPETKLLSDALDEIKSEFGNIISLKFYAVSDIDQELVDDETFMRDLRTADIVLLDMRPLQRCSRIVEDVLSKSRNTVVVLFATASNIWALARLGSFEMRKYAGRVEYDLDSVSCEKEVRKGERIRDIIKKVGKLLPIGSLKHGRNWAVAIDYWDYGGKENLKNLLLFLTKEYGKYRKLKPQPPLEIPEIGIYHPKYGVFTKIQEYVSRYNFHWEKPTVGLIFFRGTFFEQSKPIVNVLVQKLEPEVNVIPVFANCDETNPRAFREFFFKDGKPLIDALFKVQCHRFYGPLGEDPRVMLDILERLDVPIFLSTPSYLGEIRRWEDSKAGLMPMEVVVNVMRPELDGCIEPVVVGGLTDSGFSEDLGTIREMSVIEDRVDRCVNRVLNWLKLKRKKNAEKRVAIVIYNYPPGESNLGNASYLDVFGSIEKLLKEMKRAGYNVTIPDGKIVDIFEERNLINSPQWISKEKFKGVVIPTETYLTWFDSLPEKIREDIRSEWGDPPGNVMVAHGVMIPGIILGNVFIGLQPSRGVHENPEKAYHDITIPPHHQYVAFYRWLEEEFKADAVIHMGTHGTLEFLKGKEVGLSKDCFPDALIGNLPNIYVYWVTNTSEATIAKRRSYAVIVNHKTPPFTTSDLYEELRELEDLVEEYSEAKVLDPPRAELVRKEALEKAKMLNFKASSIEELHRELTDMERSIIPKGLHVLGAKYSREDVVNYITYVTRYDREVKSLHRILAEARGLSYEDLLQNPSEVVDGKTHSMILSEIEEQAREIISKILDNPRDESIFSSVPKNLREDFNQIVDFVYTLSNNIEKSDEMGSILKALDGKWIQPNIGGDPIRTPEVFPTGSNQYGFDARLVPSSSAYERGKRIAEVTLQQYFKKHGKYPETVSVVLWGFETMKTRGETIGQILHYIGVRPVRKRGPWVTDLELVPLNELNRPRIDVVVTICGIFRDTFPNLILLLDRAFRLVASQNESPNQNYVKRHSGEIAKGLSGVSDVERDRLSILRVFGPSSSEYATSVRALIETSNWEDESQLAQAYLESMQYAYGENFHAKVSSEIFRELLKSVDMVHQIRDTNEFEITDLDHYYEFFGGLSKAVEVVKGDKPEMLISDTTKEIIQTDNVSKFVERGVRTRILNPKWIDGMLVHDYHGVQKIADRVEYVLGLAATTGAVDNWVWSNIAERYIFDEEMRKRLTENNRWATAEIINRLFEANKRGYWKATEEELEKLRKAFLEIEGEIEETLEG
ncbi:MAG: magnesium chelatase subunit H [Candidatus Freyrarchaeum guaymaensis]